MGHPDLPVSARTLALHDAARVLAPLKDIPPERRMDALAIAVRFFCDTDGTMELADA